VAQRIGIAVDSTADFPAGMTDQLQLEVIPVHIFVDGEDYLHGVSISNQEVIDQLKREREIKTAPPFPGEYSAFYEKLASRYDRIFSFHVSAELSNCYKSAVNSLRILPEETVEKIAIIDTRNATIGQALIVKKAVELIRKQGRIDTLEAFLAPYLKNTFMYFSVDNLYWLKRAGKTGLFSSFLGNVLDIKPIIGLENGRLLPLTKARGKVSVIDNLVEYGREAHELARGRHEIWIAHADAVDTAMFLQEELSSRLGIDSDKIEIVDIGPTISAHTGPGCLCLAVLPEP
jgi:DegV family protein with EDD domain